MNKVILMGRLVKDPEIRYTQSGKNVATFTLAVDRGLGKDAPDNAPKADFIPIVAWNKLADVAGNYLGKGRQVLIEGHMQVRNYDAQDGSKRYVTEVITEKIDLIGSKSDNAGGNYGSSQRTGNSFGGIPAPNDDIPF